MPNKHIVLITGASRGIGKAIAYKFAEKGCHTIINCRQSVKELLETAEAINHLTGPTTKCLPIVADVSDPFQVQQMFEEIKVVFDHVDILINNAGISQYQLLNDTSINDWQQIINTNLNSAFYMSKKVLPHMIHKKSGSIVNISSIWGTYGASMEVAYSTAKAGLHGFTKALAKEVGPSGIRVNAVACGLIDTKMNKQFSSEALGDFTDDIALLRSGKPEEIATSVYHIAKEATYMTGEIIHIDGGY